MGTVALGVQDDFIPGSRLIGKYTRIQSIPAPTRLD